MTAAAFVIAAALLSQAQGSVVELSCSDNATCIENMAREFVRSIRQQKAVRLFDMLTVEPLTTRQARSNEGPMSKFLQSHAFSFDWNDYTFKLWKALDRNDAMDVEIYEGRSATDVSEDIPKKSKSKVEEEEEDDDDKKSPKHRILRRRSKKKIMQAVIPMLFGMKSTAAVMFAMFMVTVLTMKAFVASKLALMVTVGMAMKRLYESYSLGVGLQNHPYLYSQYPIDFPSASSHAYSVSGVSQFPEMYNPTALAQQQTEFQHNDASAQQSQQAPTVQLLNSTRSASERWDGKSKLQKLLEPIVDGIRSYIDPIANVFYSMPATFRGLNSDVDVKTTKDTKEEEEPTKKPREILVAQPRNIAQRKMNYRKPYRTRPKKYTELKVDLDKLKNNKDLYDYIKTKKYKYNYLNTYYYPRVRYFVNPNMFITRPKNNRIIPYKKEVSSNIYIPSGINITDTITNDSNEWKPIILVPTLNITAHRNMTSKPTILVATRNISTTQQYLNRKTSNSTASDNNINKHNLTVPPLNKTTIQSKFSNILPSRQVYKKLNSSKKRKRVKRSIGVEKKDSEVHTSNNARFIKYNKKSESSRGFFDFLQMLLDEDPITAMIAEADRYTKSVIKSSLKSDGPPQYYTYTYEMLMMCLDVIDGLVQVHDALSDHVFGSRHKKKQIHKYTSHSHSTHYDETQSHDTNLHDSILEEIHDKPEYEKPHQKPHKPPKKKPHKKKPVTHHSTNQNVQNEVFDDYYKEKMLRKNY